MKRTLLKCGALAVSALSVGATSSLLTAGPANAVLSGTGRAITVAGSDTTEQVMRDIMTDLNGSTVNGHAISTFSIPATPALYQNNTPGWGISGNQYPVTGDTDCGTDVGFGRDTAAPASNTPATFNVAPFGSGAGRKWLVAQEAGNGGGTGVSGQKGSACIDAARSSGGPTSISGSPTQESASFEYYAFAIDAVSWATTSLKAPATLTRQQITDIYDCTNVSQSGGNSTPITDWSQLPGGSTGPIQRYFPQPGSGTRSFFDTDVLLNKGSTYGPPSVSGTCPDPVLIEENEATAVADADKDKAILPYSAALWSYQARQSLNPTLDRRNGAKEGGITTLNGTTPVLKANPVRFDSVGHKYRLDTTATGVVKETNVKAEIGSGNYNEATGNYPGIRFVYNVLDNSLNSYSDTLALLGMDNASPGTGVVSPVCNNSELSVILLYGFEGLSTSGGTTSNNNATNCRKFVDPA